MSDVHDPGGEVELRRKQQAFIESVGEIPQYERSEFDPLVGEYFVLEGMNGPAPVELKLDEIESLSENVVKRRKNIRRFPFILEFTAPDKERLPDGAYKLTPKSKPGVEYFLMIKALDHIIEDNLMIYESVLN